MSEKDPKDPPADVVDREVEAAAGGLAGLPAGEAEALKEKIRRRVREEMEAELRVRTESERKEAARLARERRAKEREQEKGETFERFNRNFRFQHMVLFSSVVILIITGMPLKFPEFVLSRWLIGLWGGIQNSTIVHRV
ncbi:MAG: hypothetical protein H6Q84_2877, partial [Deltaproteobacteria bacterium]|nr:hypothetical protein [Deltaproteobacteria bacterium]